MSRGRFQTQKCSASLLSGCWLISLLLLLLSRTSTADHEAPTLPQRPPSQPDRMSLYAYDVPEPPSGSFEDLKHILQYVKTTPTKLKQLRQTETSVHKTLDQKQKKLDILLSKDSGLYQRKASGLRRLKWPSRTDLAKAKADHEKALVAAMDYHQRKIANIDKVAGEEKEAASEARDNRSRANRLRMKIEKDKKEGIVLENVETNEKEAKSHDSLAAWYEGQAAILEKEHDHLVMSEGTRHWHENQLEVLKGKQRLQS